MLSTTRTRRPIGITITHIALAIAIGFGALAGAAGYWGVVVAPDLTRSPNDAAVIAASRTVERGEILDRNGRALARNERDDNENRAGQIQGRDRDRDACSEYTLP